MLIRVIVQHVYSPVGVKPGVDLCAPGVDLTDVQHVYSPVGVKPGVDLYAPGVGLSDAELQWVPDWAGRCALGAR